MYGTATFRILNVNIVLTLSPTCFTLDEHSLVCEIIQNVVMTKLWRQGTGQNGPLA